MVLADLTGTIIFMVCRPTTTKCMRLWDVLCLSPNYTALQTKQVDHREALIVCRPRSHTLFIPFCLPQATLLVVSMQKRLFMHYPSIGLSLYKGCWTVERCTMTPSAAWCSWSSLEVICGLSVTILTILHLCLSYIFLGLPHLSFTRTVPVAFHFLLHFWHLKPFW